MNRLEGIKSSELYHIAFSKEERAYLEELSQSKYSRDRKLCLDFIDNSILVRNNRKFALDIIDELIKDNNNDIRWKSFVVLGELIEKLPDKVWPFVLKYGTSRSSDMRSAVACCLVEHILQYHFDDYFPKLETLILSGNKNFLFVLEMCAHFGQAEKKTNKKKINSLIKNMQTIQI